jgi:colicin import membrane protein
MSLIRPNTEKYVTVHTAKGGKSQACGDPVSMSLAGATLEEVRKVGEAFGITDWQKYEQRNPGQQRMMIGNRIRGTVAKMQRAKDAAKVKASAEGATIEDRKHADAMPDPLDLLAKVTAGIAKRVQSDAEQAAKAKAEKAAKAEAAKLAKAESKGQTDKPAKPAKNGKPAKAA